MPLSPTAPTASPNQQARRASLQILSRNIDRVVLGRLSFRTWYYSPYPDSVIMMGDQQQQQRRTLGDSVIADNANANANIDEEARLRIGLAAAKSLSSSSKQHSQVTSAKLKVNGSVPARKSLDRMMPFNSNANANSNAQLTPIVTTMSSHSSGTPCECLYVCPYCFRYTPRAESYAQHLRRHCVTYSPYVRVADGDNDGGSDGGAKTASSATSDSAEDRSTWPVPDTAIKVYEHNGYTVWDVDGEREKLYCQNLSLFGKLFLEQKSVFFDTGGFHYFVLTYTPPPLPPPPPSAPSETEQYLRSRSGGAGSTRAAGRQRTSSGSKSGAADVTDLNAGAAGAAPLPTDMTLSTQVLGFFSKENLSWDANNLACILVFPPYQHRNLGQLLMGVSYKLSGWEWEDSIIGGPEKPLSAMGRRSYLRFWSERIARFMMGQTADADGRRVFGNVRKKKKASFHQEEMTVKEIGERTGMLAEDVVAALNEMGVAEVMPPKKKQRKSDGDDNGVRDEEEMLTSVIVHRSKVFEWVKERRVDLISPVKEEGFLGEWALSETDDDSEQPGHQEETQIGDGD